MQVRPIRKDSTGTHFAAGQKAVVRTYAAGVFAGTLESLVVSEGIAVAVVKDARRLWKWAGAASLSQLSQAGTSKPKECQFPQAVPEVTLFNVIEILPLSETAEKSINSVPVWKE